MASSRAAVIAARNSPSSTVRACPQLNASTEPGSFGCYKCREYQPGGTVTAGKIIMVALLAWAILAPPAFLWLGVMLEQRRWRPPTGQSAQHNPDHPGTIPDL